MIECNDAHHAGWRRCCVLAGSLLAALLLSVALLANSVTAGPPKMDPTYGLPLPAPATNTNNSALQAQWIWAANTANQQTIYTRTVINPPRVPSLAIMSVTADNCFTLYVNGHLVDQSVPYPQHDSVWKTVHRPVVTAYLNPGPNVIAIMATNVDSPAGLIARLDGDGQALTLSDKGWKVWTSSTGTTNWATTICNDADWPNATLIADIGGALGMVAFRVGPTWIRARHASLIFCSSPLRWKCCRVLVRSVA